MAKSVNKVILLGNVGKEPEFKVLPSGQAVANFSVATSERYKDKGGEWQDRTEWHNLVAYAKLAEIVRDYVKKGSKLYVEGRITTRSWDDKESGKKVYRTEIVIGDLSLLSGRGEGDGQRRLHPLQRLIVQHRFIRPARLRRLRPLHRNHRRRYSVLRRLLRCPATCSRHLSNRHTQRWISINSTHASRSAAMNEKMVPATSQYKPPPVRIMTEIPPATKGSAAHCVSTK